MHSPLGVGVMYGIKFQIIFLMPDLSVWNHCKSRFVMDCCIVGRTPDIRLFGRYSHSLWILFNEVSISLWYYNIQLSSELYITSSDPSGGTNYNCLSVGKISFWIFLFFIFRFLLGNLIYIIFFLTRTICYTFHLFTGKGKNYYLCLFQETDI